MRKSNLIQLLSKLSKDELDRFGKFAESPYFNSNRKVVEFFSYLRRFYPGFDSPEMTKEAVYRKLYGGGKTVQGTVYYLISETESLLEKFISTENVNSVAFDIAFLEELTKWGMHNLFDSRLKELKKKIGKFPDELNLNRYILSEAVRNNSFQRKDFLTKKDLDKKEWTETSTELIAMFIRNNLRNILILSNYNNLIAKKLEIPMLKQTMEYAETTSPLKDNEEIRALLLGIRLITGKKEEDYRALKKVLSGRRNELPQTTAENLHIVLNNYLIEGNLPGGGIPQDELFELSKIYVDNLDKGGNKRIPVDAFLNVVRTATASRNYRYAEKFIKTYSGRLEDKHRDILVGYAKASLYVEYREYEKAHNELAGIKTYSVVFLKPLIRHLQLIVYAELGLHAEALDLIRSYEQFLRNDRFHSAQARTRYRDFIMFYRKYLKACDSGSRKKFSDLLGEIKKHKRFVLYHSWLERKIGERLKTV